MMTTNSSTPQDQRTTIEKLLADEQVLVHINPRQPGVVIPPYLMDNRTVTLRLSRFFRGRLATDDDQIKAELLFGPDYFDCSIPWTSIWGASSVRGEEFVWTEATPPEILHLVLSQHDFPNSEARSVSQTRRRSARAAGAGGHLRRVK
jgi:hypothetical protein